MIRTFLPNYMVTNPNYMVRKANYMVRNTYYLQVYLTF